jgi:hypothetical protein
LVVSLPLDSQRPRDGSAGQTIPVDRTQPTSLNVTTELTQTAADGDTAVAPPTIHSVVLCATPGAGEDVVARAFEACGLGTPQPWLDVRRVAPEMADAEHSEVGDNIVVRHATDAATQMRVRDALQHSLDAWWQFFDGIQAAM